MKSSNNILIAALAGVALSLFAGSTQIQAKGAEKLLQLNGSAPIATVAPKDAKTMSCSKCTNAFTSVADTTSQGNGARTLVAHGVPTKIVASHPCDGCATTISTVGVGKQAKDVVTHKCAMSGAGSMACCK